jgi:ATP-binding cassette subfamily B protein RaxB
MRFGERLVARLRARLPVLLQTEIAECGIACLAMIASYHGHRADVGALRRRFGTSGRGTTFASLVHFGAELGLASRAVRLGSRDLSRLRLPCILHWRFTHFVVLARVRRGDIEIHDPATGARTVPSAELREAFTGVALELWPAPSFERRTDRRSVRLRDVTGKVDGASTAIAQVLLLAVALEIFVLANPLYLQWTVDHVLVTADRNLLALLVCGFGVVMICEKSVAALRAWIILHFETLLNVQWHANVFSHLIRLPLPFFEKRHLGDIVSRFRSIDAVQRTVTTALIEAIVDGAMALALFALMLHYHASLAAICAAATLLYALVRVAAHGPLKRAAEDQIAGAAKQESHFIETVRGLRAIKLFERQDERRGAWLALLGEQVNAGVRGQQVHVALRLANGLILGSANLLVLYFGARAVLDAGFSVGMLIAFVSYQRQFAARVGALIEKSLELRLLGLHVERLAEILLADVETPSGAPRRLLLGSLDKDAAAIEVRGLRFRYAEREPYVLNGLDFAVAAGECVAIVGASGCGKSTLVNLLLGVLPVSEGEIVIAGTRVGGGAPPDSRHRVGSVTQNDTLFAGTIADNISFFDAAADQRRIEECARTASIHAEIAALPMGYNTFVGYLGSLLSAGQQQRILLARALYGRPSILILDEATSHLDLEREMIVSAAIRALHLTRVIVAHRPQTAATADRVITLERGRIAADTRLGPPVAAQASSTPSLPQLAALDERALALLAASGC